MGRLENYLTAPCLFSMKIGGSWQITRVFNNFLLAFGFTHKMYHHRDFVTTVITEQETETMEDRPFPQKLKDFDFLMDTF